jgi:energy-coupling factor transporter transmembrane protein EcfT
MVLGYLNQVISIGWDNITDLFSLISIIVYVIIFFVVQYYLIKFYILIFKFIGNLPIIKQLLEYSSDYLKSKLNPFSNLTNNKDINNNNNDNDNENNNFKYDKKKDNYNLINE